MMVMLLLLLLLLLLIMMIAPLMTATSGTFMVLCTAP
jgi:hypothetical protein